MTPITRQDILAHQGVAPWAAQYQVEQDLLLCRSMAALFADSFLRSQIAMRGGTLLHKVHLAPASRYSEDIRWAAMTTDSCIPKSLKNCSQPRASGGCSTERPHQRLVGVRAIMTN